MAKVYVSSTVLDLKAERATVIDWLLAAGHQPVHSYRPDSETVRESCLDDVDTCDVYVLVLGHRYGFQPEDGNPDRLSITHLEFRRAGASQVPRIALLRTSVPDIAASDLLNPARSALVASFIDEVRREVRAGEFADLQGLVQGLSTGVPAALSRRAPQASPSPPAADDARVVRILATLVDERTAENQVLKGRIEELESQLKAAINWTVSAAARPDAGRAEHEALSALERGDCGPAGALMALEEERQAARLQASADQPDAAAPRHEAAALARAQGALAATRDVQSAVADFERAATYDPEDVHTLYLAGELHGRLGNLAEAMNAFRRGLGAAERLAAERPRASALQQELIAGHNRIGDVLIAQGDADGALEAYRRGLEIAEALAAADPTVSARQRDVAVSLNRVGDVSLSQGLAAEALAVFLRGSSIVQTLSDADPANTLLTRDLSIAHNKVGEALFAQRDVDDALVAHRLSLAIAKTLAVSDPWNREWQRDVSVSHNNVGDVLLAKGDLEGALGEFQQALSIRAALAEEDSTNTDWQRDLSFNFTRLADVYEREGRPSTALDFASRGLVVDERLAALDPSNVTWQKDVTYSRALVARLEAAVASPPRPTSPTSEPD